MKKMMINLFTCLLAIAALGSTAYAANSTSIWVVNQSKSSISIKLDNASSDYNTCSMGKGCVKTGKVPSKAGALITVGGNSAPDQSFHAYLYTYLASSSPQFVGVCDSDGMLNPNTNYKAVIEQGADNTPKCKVELDKN